MTIKRTILIILLITALFSIAATLPAFADDIFVDPTGENGYPTIREAFDNSQSGDTIIIPPGTYTENGPFEINHLITFRGDGTGEVNFTLKADSLSDIPSIRMSDGGTATFINMTLAEGGTLSRNVAGNDLTLINVTCKIQPECSSPAYTASRLVVINSTIVPNPNSGNGFPCVGGYCLIKNNTFCEQALHLKAFWIGRACDSVFCENNFSFTTYQPIVVGSSKTDRGLKNTWYLNNFCGPAFEKTSTYLPSVIYLNSQEPVQYTYNGVSYTGYVGNYWHDYTGVDANGDGIGDTPYEVRVTNGELLGTDYYPLVAPLENYRAGTTTSTSTPTPTPSADWPVWQRDVVHSGWTESSAPVDSGSLAWCEKVNSNGGSGVDVTPLVVGDKVFVFDCNATMWAFSKTDGSRLWVTNTTSGSLQTSIPAYGDGRLFAATAGGDVYAFDPETGSVLWNTHVTDGNFECPLTYYDGRLFIGEGLDGGVTTKYYYAINAETGSVSWSYPVTDTAGFIWDGAVIVDDYLVFPSFEGTLYSVYAENGTPVSSVNLTKDVSFARADLGMIRSSVTYKDSYIYATSENGQPLGYVFKVGFSDGQFADEGWSTLIGFSTSTPVVYDGRVYVGAGEHGNPGKLVCLEDSTGTILWNYTVTGGVKSSPALYVDGDEQYVYFTGAQQNGSLYCVDRDGNLKWSYNPPDTAYILQGGAISDGVYFGTDAGFVYCLRDTEIPDLSITISPVGDLIQGVESNINLTIFNLGTADSGACHVVLSDDVSQIGTQPIGTIAPGGSVEVQIPWTPSVSGIRRLTAVVDPENVIAESNEYNNEETVSVLAGSSDPTATPVPVVSGPGWEQFHKDTINLGYADGTAPETGTLLWESPDVNAWDATSVAVAEGMVFVNGDTLFSALNMSDGSVVWSVPVKGDTMSYGSWSSPAYADSMVFLPNDAARWAANGTKVWKYRSLPWSCDSSPTVADDKVFLGDWDGHESDGIGEDGSIMGHYFAFNETTGQQIWRLNVSGYAQGTPAYHDGQVYLTSWSYFGSEYPGHIYCVNADTGDIVWMTNLTMNACGSPTVVNGTVYVTTYNFYGMGDLYALSEADGSVLWQKTIERTDSTPAIAYGNVYVCGGALGFSEGQKTYCFNATTGDQVWETGYSLGAGDWTCSVAVADGKVYVGKPGAGGMDFSYAGIYCLDAFTGNVIWFSENGGCSPAIVNGTVFTVDNHKVYAYKDPLPTADFSANITAGEVALSVQFTDNSIAAASWAWDFDNDGTVDSNLQNPAYTYNAVGVYTVKLTVSNSAGSDAEAKDGYITVTAPTATPTPSPVPAADFTADVVNGCMPLTVHYADMSTDATSYEWDFDSDGTTDSTEQNPEYTYSTSGVYTVTLKATNTAGTDTEIKTDYITVYPIPDITVSPPARSVSNGATGTYDITVDQLPYGLAGYAFNLSLDHPETGEIVSISYPAWASLNSTLGQPGDTVRISAVDLNSRIQAGATGVVLATVTVRGDNTGTSSLVINGVSMDYDGGEPVLPAVTGGRLDVYEGLTAEFSATPGEGVNPLAVQFTDLSTGTPGAESWQWDFDGDGVTDSTLQNPLYTYAVPGRYTVALTVANQYGTDTETKTGLINVRPRVEAFPGCTMLPTDPDGDGLYEDVNGNGRLDFDDVVVYYQNMQWIQDNANVGIAPYDFNGNGRIDYDDVVTLYWELLEIG